MRPAGALYRQTQRDQRSRELTSAAWQSYQRARSVVLAAWHNPEARAALPQARNGSQVITLVAWDELRLQCHHLMPWTSEERRLIFRLFRGYTLRDQERRRRGRQAQKA